MVHLLNKPFVNEVTLTDTSSKPIILGEPSLKGEFADNFGFQEDPPDF